MTTRKQIADVTHQRQKHMRYRLYALLLSAGLAAPGSSQPGSGEQVIEPSGKQLRQLQALTPAEVRDKVTVSDDSLEPIATLTTKKAWSSKGGFTDKVRSDNFLRAFVQKSTGAVRYQLYAEVTYGGDWRRFRHVNFATSSGPVSVDLVTIDSDINCAYGPCVYREIVGFDLPDSLLREIAAQYVVGASPLWRFRLKAQNGIDWEDRIAPAEAAGLLLAVEAFLDGQ